MYSRCPNSAGLIAALLACALPGAAGERVLRVCADPNNLPFSNERGEGIENRLAEVLAHDMGATLETTWWQQRDHYIRNTIDAGRCDVVMGVPALMDDVSATRPYYRSTYVFVSRRDRNLKIASLDDPRLAGWKIGLHVVGEDYAPPSKALARRGLAANVKGYSLFGKFGEESPPARILDAVERGEVDVAIVWGPLAGYFARRSKVPFDIAPVSPAMFLAVPFTYDIAVGVKKGNEALRAELDAALSRECPAVRALLAEYGVPLAAGGGVTCESPRGSQSAALR